MTIGRGRSRGAVGQVEVDHQHVGVRCAKKSQEIARLGRDLHHESADIDQCLADDSGPLGIVVDHKDAQRHSCPASRDTGQAGVH